MINANFISIKTEYTSDKVWLAYFSKETIEKYYWLDEFISSGETESKAKCNLIQRIQNEMFFFTEVYNALDSNYANWKKLNE